MQVTGYETQEAGITLARSPQEQVLFENPRQLHSDSLNSTQPHMYKVHVDYVTFVTGDGMAHMAAISRSQNSEPRVVAFKTGDAF